MSQIIKAFTGIVMVMFLMLTAGGILGAFLQMTNAQDLHSSMIDEVENSHYAVSVLQECFEIVEQTPYEVEIHLYSETQTPSICKSLSDIPTNVDEISLVKIILRYPIQIVFFDLNMKQEIFGYAR